MKNKVLVIVAIAAIFLVASFATATNTAVPIPEEINIYLTGLIFAAVTAGFTWLFKFVGLDLRSYAEPIAGTLSLFLLATLQNWINLIDGSYDAIVKIAFNIIVVILSGIGTLYVLAKQRQSQSLLQ